MTASQNRIVSLVHRSPSHRDGGDPALDLEAPGAAALITAYARSRSDADREALPLKPGMRLAEFTIRRVSQNELRFVREGRSPAEQAQRAFLAGCHAYTDADGREHKARVQTEGTATWADDEWLDLVGGEFGGEAVDEIGHAVIQWAMAPRSALAPFGSVPGLVLAR
jgi:hypothetical protein